ncbi:hypothetical protein M5K25_022845 [Dendrobium thyrsiflorum]|uniref:Protein NRDE2 homolog n=1 Tax=Dendrobium thyrsiflorum TaxID=117978 RepID=A0ABD0U709_DENTH
MDAANLEATGNERGPEAAKRRPQSPVLFPLFLSSDLSPSLPETSEPAKWLCNPSFTFDVSAVPTIATAAVPMAVPFENSDEEEAAAPRKPYYEPVSSPSSSESERPSERKEKEKGRRRKRKRAMGREKLGHESSRKSGVRAWIGSETKPGKDYYFDVHGDRDNLAFGCLYRMDVARHKLQNHSDLSEFDFELLYHRRSSISSIDNDHDLDVLDTKLKGGRYYSVKFTALERHKGFKHIKVVKKKPSLIPGEYIPLVELHITTENGRNELNSDVELEESWEDELLRRTRELNKMSRDFPHDEKVWLAFAEFQDKVASTQPQKAARLQTLEKKINILEKAVELNPDNEELLLCLLKSYQERDTTESLMEKWEKVLMRHFDSVRLWKEFLLVRQGEFSQFKVSDIRKTYGHAIQALSSACNKLCRQGYQSNNLKSKDSSLVQLELGLVDIYTNLCRFEWQTGHQELATGLFQAEIEYSLFCPSLLLSSHSKQKLFEHFWNSSGARLGEDGALGWSTWLEEEEQNRKETISEEIVEESEGGWSGWMDPFSKESIAKEENSGKRLDVESTEDNPDNEFTPLTDDVETLLKKLGVDVNADPRTEVKDTITWKKWSQEELSRDSEQWMPIRAHSGNCGSLASPYSEDIQDMDRDQLSRVILFEDVNQYLFSLCSNEARYSLVSQFIEFFGGKIPRWTCTNNASWLEKVLSLESLEDSISEDLRDASNVCNGAEHPVPMVLESLLGSNSDICRNTSIMMFLRNAILLCLNAFPRNHILEEALITVEELSFSQMSTSISSTKPSRALAKSLLKKDRQDLLLCGVYARSEAAYGNIDIARNIFDMALSSAIGLPMELMEHIPLLYLWYAEMEMAACNSNINAGQFSQRAVHILSCLGGKLKYSPFTAEPSGLDILRARQGFKEQVKNMRSAWAHGDVKESSVALIRSASLFELLTTGWSAGIQIIREAFSMALPERRSHSLQLESLWMHHLRTLQKYIKQLKFSGAWEVVAQSLQMYPYNPKSFSTMVEVSCLFTAQHKVRQLFDEYMQRKPSVIVWLFALAFELGKPGTEHRVHGLFEKALAIDKLQKSALLWRCYLAYETDIACNPSAARRIFFRAIHACPWSKRLWLDGFQKLSSILSAKELSDLQEVMRDKEIHLRTDIYEILLQDEMEV